MAFLPETRAFYTDNPDHALILKPPTPQEFSGFYPLPELVTRYLTESDQRTIGDPRRVCLGPQALGQESLVAGLYAEETGNGGYHRLIGIGYVLAPELDYPAIGQYIMDPETIRKGYGALGLHALTRHVLQVLDKPFVQATTLEANTRAQHLLTSAGFFQTRRKNLWERRAYGPSLSAQSQPRQWLLYKPGDDYDLPAGKFGDPELEWIGYSKRMYVKRNTVIDIERY